MDFGTIQSMRKIRIWQALAVSGIMTLQPSFAAPYTNMEDLAKEYETLEQEIPLLFDQETSQVKAGNKLQALASLRRASVLIAQIAVDLTSGVCSGNPAPAIRKLHLEAAKRFVQLEANDDAEREFKAGIDVPQSFGDTTGLPEVQQAYSDFLRKIGKVELSKAAVDSKSSTGLKIKNSRSKIDLNFAIARACFEKKDYKEAFRLYEENRQALQKLFGPNDLSLAYCDANMSLIRYAEGQNADGLLLYQKAISLARKVLLVGAKNHLLNTIKQDYCTSVRVIELNNEAALAINKGNLLPAIADLKKALAIDPCYELVRENLSIAYNNYGLSFAPKCDLALKQFEKSLFYDRGNSTVSDNLDGCFKMISKNPQSVKDRIELAEQALKENEPERAVSEYSEAIRIDPSCISAKHAYYVPSLLSLAWYYASKGDNDQAGSLVKQSLENLHQQAANERNITFTLLRNCSQFVPDNILTKEELKQFRAPRRHRIKRYCLQAAELAGNGKTVEAEDSYKKMLTKYDELSEEDCDRSIASCLLTASLFFDDHDKYQDSLPILTKALENYLQWGWTNPDYSKYMANMQTRIKSLWMPPQGPVSKRTIVDYQIYRDGQIGNLKLKHPSGNALLDRAGLDAVEKSSPFPILPVGSESPVDIEFTFNYHVYK